MKQTVMGLAVTAILLGATGSAFAADAKPCTPHKPGYVLDEATGKCVKAPN